MSTYDYKHFNVTFPKDGVAVVEINRPDALNAFFRDMWLNFRSIMDQLADDPNCRVIILTGAGDKAFTAGLDIKKAGATLQTDDKLDGARTMRNLRTNVLEFQDCLTSAERSLKPIISVLHGYSYGLAIDLACITDIRLCTRDVKLSIREVDIGLAADIGTLNRLPKLVGNVSWIKDLAYTARTFGSEEALRNGFVSQVFDDKKAAMEGAMKMAETIAGKSPVAVQSSKEFINFSLDHPVDLSLRYAAIWNSGALQTKDVGDAIKGILTNQKPKFSKL